MRGIDGARGVGVNERGEHPVDNFLIRGTRFNTGTLLCLPESSVEWN